MITQSCLGGVFNKLRSCFIKFLFAVLTGILAGCGGAATEENVLQGGIDIGDEISAVTPTPDIVSTTSVITPEPSAVTPEPPAITPEPSAVTPELSAVTPEPAAVTPEPPAITPEPSAVTPEPAAVTPTPQVTPSVSVTPAISPSPTILPSEPVTPIPTLVPTLAPTLVVTPTPGTLACERGTTTTQWASHCPSAPASCVAGTWNAPEGGSETGAPLRYESEHFAFYWKDGTDITTDEAKFAAERLEFVWDSYMTAPILYPEPYCNSAKKWKAAVHFDNDFPLLGGGWGRGGNSYMGMWVGPGAAQDKWGLAHEFVHGLQSLTASFPDCGGNACWIYESHANWMPHQVYRDEVHCSDMLANMPHLYYGSSRNRYCNWQFFEFVKDKYCPTAVHDMWTSDSAPVGQRDPWQKLMVSQGWDIETLNDKFGEWAMHNVTWDYQNIDGSDQGAVYRQNYGKLNEPQSRRSERFLRITQLEPLTDEWQQTRRFVSPYYWAPQRWGYNVIRLYPEDDASSVTVKFRGVNQREANSGWRWGLIATNSEHTAPRYSELQKGSDSEINFCVTPGEELYMVVLAAPTEYQKIVWSRQVADADGTPYPTLYRYPYMVEYTGAWPAGYKNGELESCPSGTVRHSNGGGCALPETPASVYVGPYAKVLGGSVSGRARIEDHATIVNGSVTGGTVGALSIIGVDANTGFNVSDNATVQSVFYPMGWFGQNLSASGEAHLIGDLEYRSSKSSSNMFYGFVDDSQTGVSPVDDVTIAPPYDWRD